MKKPANKLVNIKLDGELAGVLLNNVLWNSNGVFLCVLYYSVLLYSESAWKPTKV